jgi:pimeloyl-ACP methyl ester carboxylesterase
VTVPSATNEIPYMPTDESLVLVEGPWTHQTVRANGIALHIAEIGSGPLVLLIHGFPQFWWTWRQQLQDLAAAGFRAVAVDLRGYGASDKPPRGYDAKTLSEDVASLVTSLGEHNAVIVGHGVGGLIAWTIGATRPDVARSVVTIGSAHPLRMRAAMRPTLPPSPQLRAVAADALRYQIPRHPEAKLSDDDYVRDLFDAWSGSGWTTSASYEQEVARYAAAMRISPVAHCALESFRWLFRSIPRGDGRRYAASMRQRLTIPVLQIHGSADRCVLPQTARGSEDFVDANYEWRLLDGVGHFPQCEDPARVSTEITRWASSHS